MLYLSPYNFLQDQFLKLRSHGLWEVQHISWGQDHSGKSISPSSLQEFLHSVHVWANSADFHLQVQTAPNTNTSIKNNIVISIIYIYVHDKPVIKTIHYVVNVMSMEAELFTIRCGINQATTISDISKIIIIMDSIL